MGSDGLDPNVNPKPENVTWLDQYEVTWPKFESTESWLKRQDLKDIRTNFEKNGYVVVHDLIPKNLIHLYKTAHEMMHSGEIDAF